MCRGGQGARAPFAGIHAHLLLADRLRQRGIENLKSEGLCVETLLDGLDDRRGDALPSECVEYPLIEELQLGELLGLTPLSTVC